MPHVVSKYEVARSLRRFDRLYEKYPGWRLTTHETQLELPI